MDEINIYIYIYIYSQNLEKIQLDFNWNLNFCHMSYLIFNFLSSELLIVKIKKSKSN